MTSTVESLKEEIRLLKLNYSDKVDIQPLVARAETAGGIGDSEAPQADGRDKPLLSLTTKGQHGNRQGQQDQGTGESATTGKVTSRGSRRCRSTQWLTSKKASTQPMQPRIQDSSTASTKPATINNLAEQEEVSGVRHICEDTDLLVLDQEQEVHANNMEAGALS